MTRRDAPQDTSPSVLGQPGETDGTAQDDATAQAGATAQDDATAQADATDETDDEYEPL